MKIVSKDNIEKVKDVLTHKWAKEVYRVLPFVAVAGLVLIPDSSWNVILFGFGVIMFACLVGHVTRKILFPYFDLEKLSSGIEDDTKASAAVICAIIFLVCTIINAFVVLLH